jgi:hypothetical protein
VGSETVPTMDELSGISYFYARRLAASTGGKSRVSSRAYIVDTRDDRIVSRLAIKTARGEKWPITVFLRTK